MTRIDRQGPHSAITASSYRDIYCRARMKVLCFDDLRRFIGHSRICSPSKLWPNAVLTKHAQELVFIVILRLTWPWTSSLNVMLALLETIKWHIQPWTQRRIRKLAFVPVLIYWLCSLVSLMIIQHILTYPDLLGQLAIKAVWMFEMSRYLTWSLPLWFMPISTFFLLEGIVL